MNFFYKESNSKKKNFLRAGRGWGEGGVGAE